MEKRLRVRDKILLSLAIAADFKDEFFPSYPVLLRTLRATSFPEYKYINYSRQINRMLTSGSIEKIIKDGKPYLRMSNKGKNALIRDFPLLAWQNKPWDKHWRIVFYDIDEISRKTREQLRAKLLNLGFGMLQRSVYISPFPVAEDMREFILLHRLDKHVFVSVSRRLYAGDEKELARRVWKLNQLNKEYQKLLDWRKEAQSKERSDQEKIKQKIKSFYLELLVTDPFLPEELLPTDWVGDKTRKIVKSIWK